MAKKESDSQVVVIFGATGDLTRRKILPAFSGLLKNNKKLPAKKIVCVARREYDKSQFLRHARVKDKKLASLIEYRKYDPADPDPKSLRKALIVLKRKHKAKGFVCYLALPARLFHGTSKLIKELKLPGWLRIVYEKPFGTDLRSARSLNRQVSKYFTEDQVYRIDHYLGKELVQNMLVFRFANSIFEHIWRREFIDHVQISVCETVGVEERAGYYDSAGAVKDMLQNHLLQLVALTVMEDPVSMKAKDIHDAKVKALQSIKPIAEKNIVRGQYRIGKVGNKRLKPYRHEKNISPKSRTETFLAAKLEIGNDRWKGVPFYVRTGKRLSERYAQINIVLKDVVCNFFCMQGVVRGPNMISIRIQPDEGISVRINAKSESLKTLQEIDLDFCYPCEFGQNTPEAYEILLQEVMSGDKTLFTRWDEVESSWKLIDPLLRRSFKLESYAAGSNGPKAAEKLLNHKTIKWLRLGEKK
jgi:glucose-6-phosphate 1-dehydrogenase